MIAEVKFLNDHFGYRLTVPEYLSDDSKWDEDHFQKHLAYASAFSDPAIQRKMKKYRDRLRRKGSFAVQYELPGE